MEKHEDAICRKLLDSARDPQVVQGLQRRLALIVFDHVALKYPGENIDRLKKDGAVRIPTQSGHGFHTPEL